MPRTKVDPKRRPAGAGSATGSSSGSSSSAARPAGGGGGRFVVRIRHSRGMTRIDVDAKDTVGDLKRKIRDDLKIPASRQKLSVGPIGLDRDSGLVRELVEHGTIINLTSQQQAKRPRKEEDNKRDSSASNKKKKKPKKLQKKKKQKKNPDGPEVYEREGKTGEDIARAIRCSGVGSGLENAGERVYSQTIKEHRLSAATTGKFKITELLEPSDFTSAAVSRGRRFLSVDFSHGHKKRKEIVEFYEDDLIREIVASAVRSHTNPKRTTLKSSLRAIGAETAASYSPPLFWSVCHAFPTQQASESLQDLIEIELAKLQSELAANNE